MSDKVLGQAIALAPRVRKISDEVLTRHIQRNDVVQATWLSLVSSRPAFFLGSPGVDKTGTIESLAGRINGAVFYDVLMPTIVSVEQLLVESTSIEEMPTANGGKTIRTADALGRAAGAHILFADEIWKADPRVLQTLIDLAKGDGVRHEGQMVKTPLLAFLAASNELPDSEGNLRAIWSRMTIRVPVNPLDRVGKTSLVAARLNRDRSSGVSTPTRLTLDEVDALRKARPFVEVSDAIVEAVFNILQALLDDKASADFSWAWADDRRFGRLFDVMQAKALLDGRTAIGKQDLAVLEWLLWDSPEQIPVVKAKLLPYCRTPLSEAQELVDALLSPSGTVQTVIQRNDRQKGVQALDQSKTCVVELERLKGEAGSDGVMTSRIADLISQVAAVQKDIIAVMLGTKVSA